MLSRYPCKQCGGRCEDGPPVGVGAVTRSHAHEPGWTPDELAAKQASYPDVGPIIRRKTKGDNRPPWEEISPESQDTKILWRQWEHLFLVRGVLHRRYHKVEGHSWRYQLEVPEGPHEELMQRLYGGEMGANLGTDRTLVLLEHGFYWPRMPADVKRTCTLLKPRRGRQEPLHQYEVGVLMERLAMDVAGPYPVTSSGNQYLALIVGCYFSKWLECFPIAVDM